MLFTTHSIKNHSMSSHPWQILGFNVSYAPCTALVVAEYENEAGIIIPEAMKTHTTHPINDRIIAFILNSNDEEFKAWSIFSIAF